MRPQFFLILVIVTTSLLGAVFYLKQPGNKTPSGQDTAQITPPASAVTAAVKLQNRDSALPPIRLAPLAPPAAKALSPAQREAAIEAEIELLQKLSLSADSNSLPPILADLTSPEREIRDAAVDAAREFGSADAIPALKAAADYLEDIPEKISMLEAANFLSLPGLKLESRPAFRTPEQLQAEILRHSQRRSPNQSHPATSVN